MGLIPSQELRYTRYDFFIVYKGDERIGVCSNLKLKDLKGFSRITVLSLNRFLPMIGLMNFSLQKLMISTPKCLNFL